MGQGFLGLEPDPWPPAPQVDTNAQKPQKTLGTRRIALAVIWCVLGLILILIVLYYFYGVHIRA